MNLKNCFFAVAIFSIVTLSCCSLRGMAFAPGSSFLESSSSFLENYSQAELGTPLFVIDVIRHGNRTPEKGIPNVDYEWPEGFGELLPAGMEVERKLGERMRKKYVTSMKLLPESYIAGTLFVECSHFDRTIMSAQCLLLGFFPLGTGPVELYGYQPVPIHTEPIEPDMMVPDDSQGDGFDFWGLVRSTVFSQQAWKDKEQSLSTNFAVWSAATGYPINGLYDLKQLGDILEVSKKNKVPLPSDLSSQDVSTIIAAGEWAYWNLYQNQQVGQASSAALLSDMYARLHKATQPNQTQKWMLYSAHSSTLMALLSALGAPLCAVPPYASDFTIALYDQGSGSYILKLTYNDSDVTLPISSGSTCSLDQFHTLAQQAMAELTTVQSEYPLGSSNSQAVKAK